MFLQMLLVMLFFFAPTVAMSLLLWLNKSVFAEYMRAFGLGRLCCVNEFWQASTDDTDLTYPKFLAQHFDGFWIRLITCPVCLGVWIAGFLNLMMLIGIEYENLGTFLLIPTVILLVPTTCLTAYVGLYLYFLLARMVEA